MVVKKMIAEAKPDDILPEAILKILEAILGEKLEATPYFCKSPSPYESIESAFTIKLI